MSKALIVLAECVDSRNGKRFMPGETFDPAPTVVQAQRLVSAGCLPMAALEAAEKAADQREQDGKRTADIAAAKADLSEAEKAYADAQTALATAEDAQRADAQKQVDTTQKAVEKAAAAVAKASK